MDAGVHLVNRTCPTDGTYECRPKLLETKGYSTKSVISETTYCSLSYPILCHIRYQSTLIRVAIAKEVAEIDVPRTSRVILVIGIR